MLRTYERYKKEARGVRMYKKKETLIPIQSW